LYVAGNKKNTAAAASNEDDDDGEDDEEDNDSGFIDTSPAPPKSAGKDKSKGKRPSGRGMYACNMMLYLCDHF
jgi:hypothetical protein